MNTKIIAVVICAVLAGFAGGYYTGNKNEPATPDSAQQESVVAPSDFVFGVIKSVSGNSIVFDAVPNGDKTAKFGTNTELTRQAKDDNDVISIKPAVLSDFKSGKQIFVYYESAPSDGVYTATKIHLIN